ncbi:MAG: FapA family protein [Thermodesulfobacteriota bacterium]|nr:FapA family protein [Thermodesulfobacteriota bacterium]
MKLSKPVQICNNSLSLNISKDRLTAFLKLNEAESFDDVQFDEILKEVQEYGVVFGFVSKMGPVKDAMVIIARGIPAVPGENAKLIPKVKLPAARIPQKEAKGKDKVNYRELGNIINVPAGQLLLEKIPPTQGRPGKNIFAERIPTKAGKDVTIKCGPGVDLSEDGLRVTATVDGKFVMDKGRPCVLEEHVINGDVDMSVGNVVFCGKSLVVNGEVLPGFELKCRGDISVKGLVNNAGLLAGGKLDVVGGIIGEDADIKVKGDAKVSFMENVGFFETRGSLTVTDYIVQGNVMVRRNLTALDGKGAVIGGNYVIGGSMHVKELGSDAEVVTEVTVGLDHELNVRKKKLEAEKEFWPGKMNELLKNIGSLNEIKKKEGPNFSEDKKKLLRQLNKKMPEVMEKTNELTEKQDRLDEDLLKATEESIYVYGTSYPGIYVKIGNAARVITDEESFVVIEFEKSTEKIHARSMTSEERTSIG